MFGKRKGGRVDGIASAPPHPEEIPKGEEGVAACDSRPAPPEQSAHSPDDSRGEASTSRPCNAETRWWLQIEVGEFNLRVLLDPGASTTVMGIVDLQLATTLERKFTPSEKRGVRLADGSRSPLLGYVLLPIITAGLTRDIRVTIMPHLDAYCYLGVNFVRAFRAVLDLDTDWLFCKDVEASVELEVASLLIDRVLGPELEPHVYAYLDDIVIVAETFEKHKECLKMVLEKLVAAGLSLNPDKCVFCKPEVAYLGFLVNRDGTRPNPAKVDPIKRYPTPNNLRDLRKFQGMASWYRRLIPSTPRSLSHSLD